jgi:ATP/maltotriose-dependent transcriptional regulator MalT
MSASVVSPVFVGRRDEMAALAAPMRLARGGDAAFALIGGEAGVGKTRLVGELAAQAAGAGFTVLIGHCIELGAEGLPLAPLVDALRALARSTPPAELAELLGPARRGLARLLPELDPDAAAGLGPDGVQAAQLLELVLGLISRLGAVQPVMLILEDLHWADQSTLELLAFLVRSLRDVPVLLLATYRSDELHRRHPLRPLLTGWDRVRSMHRIELRRFDRDEVAAQLDAILARRSAPELVDLVTDRSGGNAFLVEELAGVVRAGGDPADLPPSLRDVLLSRIDSLSPAAQLLLRTASVAGRRVPERLLAAVTDLDESALFTALRETVESHLLVVDDTGLGYAFRHALGRDAVYEDMLPGERVRLHAAYGTALAREPALADDQAAVPAALAHHWYAALDLPLALSASITAARHAMASYAPAEAQRHLERALQIWPRVPDAEQRTGLDQAEVSRLTADAAYQAGAVDRAVSLLDQALAELPADGDVVRRALLLDRRAHALRDVGHEDEAIASLDQAMTLLPADQVTRAHAVVLASLASSLMRTTDMGAAAPTAQRAVEAARAVGAAAEEADACITLGLARSYLGDGEEGLAAIRAGLDLALDLDPPTIALRGYVNLSDVLEFLGRHAEAAQTASEGLALAARVGLARTFGSYLTGNLAESLLRLGRWADADRLTARALGTFPVGIFAGTLLQLRAELAALAGRYDDAVTELRAARRALGETTDRQFVLTMLHAEATIAHGRGDLGAARELLATGLAGQAVPGPGRPAWPASARYAWPLLWLAMRVEADDAVRFRDRREPVPAAVTERCRELARFGGLLTAPTPPARGCQAAAAAEHARADGTDDLSGWAAAAAAWRAAGEPYPLAYALLRLAEAHCRAADWKAAAGAVREASSTASRIGALPLAGEAGALARRARLSLAEPDAREAGSAEAETSTTAPSGTAAAGRVAGAPGAAGPPQAATDELARFGLTEREREVFLLLATGQSNPQIGKALFISPKTVSVHVSSILAKLGVTGRIEAAAVAHRLGIVGQQA